MDASELPRAVAACSAEAAACGLPVDDAVVLNDSNRLAVHLRPCDVLARVAPRARQNGAEFEIEVARRLAETGAPLATLDPRVEPRVYEQDDFAVTLWTYYESVPPHDIAPDEYASALERSLPAPAASGAMKCAPSHCAVIRASSSVACGFGATHSW